DWSQGGLSCWVDPETGTIGPGIRKKVRTPQITHPDSGAVVSGAAIPNWSAIKDGMLAVCRALTFLPYVGWDIAVTQDGFRIIEGNSAPDVDLMQVHRPLLADERVRGFYRDHGAL